MNSPIAQIDRFFAAIVRKDVAYICQAYCQDEQTYVFVEGPRESTLGHPNIARGWQDFCSAQLQVEAIEWVEGPFVGTASPLAWVAGMVRITVQVNNRPIQRQFRTTFVLEQPEGDDWLIRHEHVSAPLDDPYGIGDWLNP